VQNEITVDSLSQSGTYLTPFLIVAAGFLLITLLIVRNLRAIFNIKNTPLTPSDVLRRQEPQPRPMEPRRPRLIGGGYGVMIVTGAMGIVCAGVTYATLHKFKVDQRFAKEGQTITGTVLSISAARHGHTVRYEFRVDGRPYHGSGNAPNLRSWANARKSKEIEISYLPSEPAINRPADETNLPILIGLALPAFLALIVFMLLSQLRRNFALAAIGRLTNGIVVGIRPGSKSSTWVYYDFLNDQGVVTRGKSSILSWKVVLGSAVEVLYLPDNPERNSLRQSMYWQA
jgi:TRAP-type C4-dicarboxylate transport system permease small subunit